MNRPRCIVGVASLLAGTALLSLAYACGKTSSGTASPTCGSLAACCGGVPATEQGVCIATAGGQDVTACSALLASYSATDACGQSLLDGGHASDAGGGCSGLAACCKTLPEDEQPSCNSVVSVNLAATCASALAGLVESGSCGGGRDASSGKTDAKNDATTASDAGMTIVPWMAGDGGACSQPVGEYPDPSCDPSDDSTCEAQGTQCPISPACGDPNTCEPFTQNPPLGMGLDNYRMRLINITAPSALTSPIVQSSVITASVDLPATTGATCGENGSGLFNWIFQVNQTSATSGTVLTGGAPASTDPVNVGYCFVNSTIQGFQVAPATLTASFTNDTFSTSAYTQTLTIPIFIEGGGAVLLPLHQLAFHSVTISSGGNCVGAVNNDSITPSSSGVCTDTSPTGPGSCARWQTAGALGGYILLSEADKVPVLPLGNESLCVLLTGDEDTSNPPTCSAAGLTAGNYCSSTQSACVNGDSVWFAAQFAASAVKISTGAGVTLCSGG